MRTGTNPMTNCSLTLVALFLIGLGLGDSPLVILSLCSLVLFIVFSSFLLYLLFVFSCVFFLFVSPSVLFRWPLVFLRFFYYIFFLLIKKKIIEKGSLSKHFCEHINFFMEIVDCSVFLRFSLGVLMIHVILERSSKMGLCLFSLVI